MDKRTFRLFMAILVVGSLSLFIAGCGVGGKASVVQSGAFNPQYGGHPFRELSEMGKGGGATIKQ